MKTPTPSEVVDFYTQFSDVELHTNEYRYKFFYRSHILKIRMMKQNVRIEIVYSIYKHFKGVFPISKFCRDLYVPISTAIRYANEVFCESVDMPYTPSDPVVEITLSENELEPKRIPYEKPSYELALFLSLGKDEVIRRYREVQQEVALACEDA